MQIKGIFAKNSFFGLLSMQIEVFLYHYYMQIPPEKSAGGMGEMKMNREFELCVPCLLGLEGPIADELRRMKMPDVKNENGRVYFHGGRLYGKIHPGKRG